MRKPLSAPAAHRPAAPHRAALRRLRATLRGLAMLAAVSALSPASSARATSAEPWPVAGRQGVLRFVIVPTDMARDRAAYAAQIERLCAPGQTCFLNFYTNTQGVEVALPLPDAIDQEATAVFRRSIKQGAELIRWSCRLKIAPDDCF